jgi:ferredoxin/flavodoxin
MNTEIYYFSGTGNSLVVARDIARKINAKLIPVASLIKNKVININADIVGIIFPVYYTDLPVIIRNFAKRLNNINNKYIFAICTYGGGIGNSLKSLNQIIHSRGGKLSAKFGVHLPQNGFNKPFESHSKLFKKWKKKVEAISMNIKLKKRGMLLSDFIGYLLLIPVHILAEIAFRNYLVKISNSPNKSNDELIYLLDKSFKINENCNGCGVCSQVCPVTNITMTNNKPVWLHHCETCLACYHWCPNKAIKGDITPKGEYYYHHPDIKISDIIKQSRIG